ncbi:MULTISPECIES: hypothetical protein [unclassified Moorena]|uniref:hypothetical protein n=1 Tax=unclassified Moorena TaxID=2683338 RepID=UPI0013FE9AB9|nr:MULTISPECIES: hypothetical protein [unclassified Moorena]NEO15228.1 hypothetical protein [Moorena sp. SIO3E8]NEQ01501.1 hypothetical protein [Moorena sp. SIO3F7]
MGETPKTALPPQDRNGAFSALRIKFATGRTSASLNLEIVWRWLNNANTDNGKIKAK